MVANAIQNVGQHASADRINWLRISAFAVVCPLLLRLAFPKTNLSVASLVALAPLFVMWSTMTWKRAFLWGWFSGVLFFGVLFSWMTNTLLSFVGSWSWLALVLLACIEGFSLAAVALIASLVGRGKFRTASIFVLPATLVVFESWRTSGSLGVPFGQLGSAAADLPWILSLAAYGSVHLLTATVALINSALAGVIIGDPSARRTGAAVLVTLAAIILYANLAQNSTSSAGPTLRVAVAQAAIAQELKWTPAVFEYTMSTYEALTRAAASSGARLVVWPETAVTSYPLQEHTLLKRLQSLAATSHAWVMAGTIDRPSSAGYYNAVMELTPEGALGGVYHKHWLLPFAEYLPLSWILRRLVVMDNASDFLAGPGPHLLSAAGYRLGTMICYESAFPLYARAATNAGADVLIVATNDDWFIGTAEPYEHADAAKIQAVASGHWVVRAAQSGISEIISPRGIVTAHIGMGKQGMIVADIDRGVETPFDRWGIGWLLALSAVVLIGGVAGAIVAGRLPS